MRLEHLLSGEKLDRKGFFGCTARFVYINMRKMKPSLVLDKVELNQIASPIAQLVRALH